MSRNTLEGNKIFEAVLKTCLFADPLVIAISGALTIPAKSPAVLSIDPTGAQNVTMPTKGGKFIYLLIHGSTNNADLTIKDSAGVTIGTLSQNEIGLVVDNGVNTFFGVAKQT